MIQVFLKDLVAIFGTIHLHFGHVLGKSRGLVDVLRARAPNYTRELGCKVRWRPVNPALAHFRMVHKRLQLVRSSQ